MDDTNVHQLTIFRDRANKMDGQIADISNLVAALEIVSWDLCSTAIHDEHLDKPRNAVVGLSNSLSKAVSA